MIGDAASAPQTYSFVTIGAQKWMLKNLDVTTYRNGDSIPQVTDPTAWIGLTTGAWCYNRNDSTQNGTFGKLYNWYAVNDPRGLAPRGWHIPSNTEFATLASTLGGADVAGGKMKDTSSIWQEYSLLPHPTNSSGFTALPAGYRDSRGAFNKSSGTHTNYWSSTEKDFQMAGNVGLRFSSANLVVSEGTYKIGGLSVRCLKD